MRFLVEKYPNKVIPRKKNVAVTCVGYIGKVSLFTLVSIYSKGWYLKESYLTDTFLYQFLMENHMVPFSGIGRCDISRVIHVEV